MTTKTYNGHKNWNYWNVALWIANDEGLYRFAKDCLRSHRNRRGAARAFVQDMNDWGDGTTPDGARYTIANVYAAMEDL